MTRTQKNYSSCLRMIEACCLYREGTVRNLSFLAKSYGVDRKSLRQRVKEQLSIDAQQGHAIYLGPAVEQEISVSSGRVIVTDRLRKR